jgi:hypothetical protein
MPTGSNGAGISAFQSATAAYALGWMVNYHAPPEVSLYGCLPRLETE